MDLKELRKYQPDTDAGMTRLENEKKEILNKDDSAFKAPLAKKPRKLLGSTPDPYANISATPGHTPRTVMTKGTPYRRPAGHTASLDLVPSSMTPNSSKMDSTPKIYPNAQQMNAQQAQNGNFGGVGGDSVEYMDEDSGDNFQGQEDEDERLQNLLEKLEQEQEAADEATKVPLIEDEKAARRLIKDLKRKFTTNQSARVKSEDPNKFWESEIELNTVLDHMRGFATAWEFYPLLDQNLFKTVFIPLMAHPNVDITILTISLLQELTDTLDETEVEEQEKAILSLTEFSKIMLHEDFNFITLLVQLMDRLDEEKDEESDGLHNCLGIIENLLELVENSWILDLIGKSGLINWMVLRLRPVPRGAKVKNVAKYEVNMGNKLYASEVLFLLGSSLTHGDMFIKLILEANNGNGLDVLIRQTSFYRDSDPMDATEAECLQNIFNILCAVVRENKGARDKFLDLEGMQLMILMIRNKCQTRQLAIKVIANMFALKGDPTTKKGVKLLIDKCLGLRSLCPILTRGIKLKKHKSKTAGAAVDISLTKDQNTENILAIFVAMFQELDNNSEYKVRLVSKFAENKGEKINRLLELHQEYLNRVNRFDKVLLANRKEFDADSYLLRLENGLYILQMTDYIIVDLASNGNDIIKDHLQKAIKMRNIKATRIATIVREYANELVPVPEEELKGDENEENEHLEESSTPKAKKEPVTKEQRQVYAHAEIISSKTLQYAHNFTA